MAGRCALHQSVISLHFKHLVRVKTSLDKLSVHIGGNHEIVLPLYHLQQMPVERLSFRGEAGIINVTGPVGPFLFLTFERVKGGCVKIRETIMRNHIGEGFLEVRAAVVDPSGGGKPGSGTDEDGIGLGNG